jgi:hypothetical protein
MLFIVLTLLASAHCGPAIVFRDPGAEKSTLRPFPELEPRTILDENELREREHNEETNRVHFNEAEETTNAESNDLEQQATMVEETVEDDQKEETTDVNHENKFSASCPNGASWCDQPLNYPSDAIVKAVAKQKKTINILFTNASEIKSELKLPEHGSSIGERMGNFPENSTDYENENDTLVDDIEYDNFENVCSLTTDLITPRAARNKAGVFRFIVNQPEGATEYLQLVKVVKCAGEREECGHGELFTSHVTQCKQEYSDHKLVALSEGGEELVIDTFSFPSCCSCVYSPTYY